jgi:hypothetical protein
MMSSVPPIGRVEAGLICCFAAAAGVGCAALVGAAALVPAPPVVLPLILAIGIGCPLALRGELRSSISVLRDGGPGPLDRRDLVRLRRELDGLPETEHPLEI